MAGRRAAAELVMTSDELTGPSVQPAPANVVLAAGSLAGRMKIIA